jgi:hypothetical protein
LTGDLTGNVLSEREGAKRGQVFEDDSHHLLGAGKDEGEEAVAKGDVATLETL